MMWLNEVPGFRPGWWKWRPIVLAVMVSSTTISTPGMSQHRFLWPDTTVDVSRYTTVEECLAATDRMRHKIVLNAYLDVDMDTMPMVFPDRVPGNPPAVLAFAQTCSRQFVPQSFSLDDGWHLLARLYWQSGRFDDFRSIIGRRLSATVSSDTVQYAAVLDTIVDVYQTIFPRQLTVSDSLLEVRLSLPPVGEANFISFKLNAVQLEYARSHGDTLLARRAARRIEYWNTKVTLEDRGRPDFVQYIRPLIYAGLNYLGYEASLDSLRAGTGSFVSVRKRNWAQATGGVAAGTRLLVGEEASMIPADFWWVNGQPATVLAADPRSAPRKPQLGRVGLIVFYGHECYQGAGIGLPIGKNRMDCSRSFAALRRLAQRFPELDITVVAETHGYFSYLDPMPPQEEAEWLRKWHHDYHRLPGTLVVTKVPSWNLESPDDRRVDDILPHVVSYAAGRKRDGRDWVLPEMAFLVSREGTVLHADRLATLWTKMSEQEFADLIDVVLTRPQIPVAGRGAPPSSSESPSQDKASTITLTDDNVTQWIRVVERIFTDIGNDTVRMRMVPQLLLGRAMSRVDTQAQHEENPFPEFPEIGAALRRERMSLAEFEVVFRKVQIASNIVEVERRQGPEHAKAAASKSSLKVTPGELDVVRRNQESFEALFKRLVHYQ